MAMVKKNKNIAAGFKVDLPERTVTCHVIYGG